MAANPVRTRLSDSQIKALKEVPNSREASITLGATIPATNYVDPARFELERAAIFEREPMLIAPSATLPKPNMFFAEELLGTPILVTRDKEDIVHAFLNVCRHRGTILCPTADVEKGPRIVCPYHAWSYKLDGQLATVPREEVFTGLDKAEKSLVELPCVEAGGLIYVGVKPGADVDFSDVTGQLATDLDGLGMGKMQVFRKTTYKLAANWKLLMDTMLDKYHVLRLHQNTLAKFFDDAPEVSHMVGPHVRSASGRKNFTAEDIGEDFEIVRRRSVFGYALFPEGAIVVSPRYVSLCVMRPVSVDETHVDFIMLITDPPADEVAADKLEQSWALMDIGFGQEDFWAAELGHKGLKTGAVPEVQLGGLEHRIKMFHDVIEERIERYQAGAAAR
jgi:phenylpropionate dioxygenase-like ring-hydroxylating dioxygenase large terminal subunit